VEVELHEDEVPEFEEAVAVTAGRAVGAAAAVLGAPVEVELGARPARPRRACLPEVLRPRQIDDTVGRNPDPLPPRDRDLVAAEPELGVAGEHGRPELLDREPEPVGDELPREVDRPVLEVVTHGEVAEHLEEGEMPSREADGIDVGCAEALLHGREPPRRRLLEPEEVRLERLHPRRRQEDRRVVCRGYQRSRNPSQMALRLEEREKCLS
jgi:hypothetical protein